MRIYDSIGYSLVEFRSSGYIFFFSQIGRSGWFNHHRKLIRYVYVR